MLEMPTFCQDENMVHPNFDLSVRGSPGWPIFGGIFVFAFAYSDAASTRFQVEMVLYLYC